MRNLLIRLRLLHLNLIIDLDHKTLSIEILLLIQWPVRASLKPVMCLNNFMKFIKVLINADGFLILVLIVL
jgi:hypothetical protein